MVLNTILNDWMTSEELPFNSKITENGDDNIFHSHTFYEIFYILEGSITHVLNGKPSVLSPGDVVFLNQNDIHSFIRPSDNHCKHRDIIIRTDFFQSLCEFLGSDFRSFYEQNLLTKHITLPLETLQKYENRIGGIILTLNLNTHLKISSIKTLLISLLNKLIEQEHSAKIEHYPMWFEDLISRFHMNEFLKTGLSEILSPYHFNKSYICRTFKKYMGCTMTDYLNDIRLQNSAFMLQNTDETILYISNNIGFSSVSYFNTVFKKKYGVSPKFFRKQQKNTSF